MTFTAGLGLGAGGLTIKPMTGLEGLRTAVGPSPAHAPVQGVPAETVLREIARCKEDFDGGEDIDEVLQNFDAAILQYLLTEESFLMNIGTVVSKAMSLLRQIASHISIVEDPKGIGEREKDLSHLGSLGDSWGALETNDPWQKLYCLTRWTARVATYPTIPTNKFTNILYPQETLVTAPNGRGGLEYIPANRISAGRLRDMPGLTSPKLIASQYPFFSYSAEMVLRIAYAEGGAIMDLTMEGDVNADETYYPIEEGEVKDYSTLSITYVREETDGTKIYVITDLASGDTKTLKRYHFKEWLDCEPLNDVEKLARLAGRIDDFGAETVIIHCRGGIGRTGTLLAAYLTLHRIQAGMVTSKNLDDDVFKTVLQLRTERGAECVQAKEQYADLLALARDRLAKRSAGTV